MLIERLHRTIEELEHLPPEAQEEAAAQLEAIVHKEQHGAVAPAEQSVLDLIGAWSDIPWEEMEAELDHIRHESTPTPPFDTDELE